MTKKVKIQELVKILSETNETEISIQRVSEVKMKKTNNPFYYKSGRSWVPKNLVELRTNGTYKYGYSYEKLVKEALLKKGKESSFEVDKLAWGQWYIKDKLIEHKGNYYIRVYTTPDTHADMEYLVDGNIASDYQVTQIKDFSPKRGGIKKQNELGLDKSEQITPKNLPLNTINWIIIEGTKYEIIK